ncbi:hypothetical protein Mapa_005470 [Marchantia paleacea]|nr:hypothetical protein Mapa_005470 [Marchantia paleacea]
MGVDTSPECRKDVKKHALLVAVSLHSHVAGILKHGIEMAQRGVKITYVGTEKDLSKLRTDEEVKGLDFNLISFEDYPSSQQIISSPSFNLFSFISSARELFQPVLDMLLAEKQAGRPGPTCIIGDRLLPFALDAAKLLEIPHYQFYSCGANFARILQAYPPLFGDGTLTMRPALCQPKGKIVKSLTEFEGENSEGVIVIPRRRKLVGHAELEKAIRFIMSEEGSALRSRVQELKRISAAAAADGGAKKKALDDLVEFIPGVAEL